MRIAGRPSGVGRRRKPNVRKWIRGRQLLEVDRRVEPLQQVLPQRRTIAHQLHRNVYGSMKSVELVTWPRAESPSVMFATIDVGHS